MLQINDTYTMHYTIPAGKTVPDLYPESPLFTAMPSVFATGYTVGLMEWACMEHLRAAQHHGDEDITLGLGMDMVHAAPCTEGAELLIHCVCTDIGKRSVSWDVRVECKDVVMAHGKHKRVVVNKQKFINTVNTQAAQIGGQSIA